MTEHDSNTSRNTSNTSEIRDDDPSFVDVDNWWLVSTVDTAAMRARYRAAWHPTTVNPATVLVQVLGEIPALCTEIDRLARLLGQARCAYANLTAAARAALNADAEGESDPWWYLRDELGQQPPTAPGTGGRLGCGGWCL